MDPLLLRITEAAEVLRVSRSTVYILIGAGVIPVVKIGSCARIPAEALRRYVEERQRTTGRNRIGAEERGVPVSP